jgi:hypothetical protein
MYFESGSLVAAVNVLLVVALVVVALLVMPLIRDYAARLITRRLRGTARLDARSARANTPKADIFPSKTEDETLKARRGASNQSRVSREALAVRAKCILPCEDPDNLMCELDKRSTLINAQKTAITALKIQVETLKARLRSATNDRDVQNLENRLAERRGGSTKATSSSSICGVKSRSHKRPRPICAGPSLRSTALSKEPPRTTRRRRQSCKLRSIVPTANARGLLMNSPR